MTPKEQAIADFGRRLGEQEKQFDEMIELLAQIREWLDGQQDVNYEGTGPNAAMRFCTEIDALIGEYT